MRTVTKTVFVTDDGKEFFDPVEAARVDLADKCEALSRKFLRPDFADGLFRSISNHPEVLFELIHEYHSMVRSGQDVAFVPDPEHPGTFMMVTATEV